MTTNLPPGRQPQIDRNVYADPYGKYALADMSCKNLACSLYDCTKNGSVIAIAGADFAVIGVDVMQLDDCGQSLHRISRRVVLGSTGEQGCTERLASVLRARMFLNEAMRQKVMSPRCIAQLLSCCLTSRRFFEKHVSILLAGLDEKGRGMVYAYDPLGFNERTKYRAMGVANRDLQPFLNKRLRAKLVGCPGKSAVIEEPEVTFDKAIELIVCAFVHAIKCQNAYVGNVIVINGITKDGICELEVPLKEPVNCTAQEEWQSANRN